MTLRTLLLIFTIGLPQLVFGQQMERWQTSFQSLQSHWAVQALPVRLVTKEAYVANTAPMRMTFRDEGSKACQLEWVPGSQWLQWLDSFGTTPPQQQAIEQALWIHELAHCWHGVQGSQLEQWLSTHSRTQYHLYKEAYADLASILFVSHYHPAQLSTVVTMFKKLRTHPQLDPSQHATHWLFQPQAQALIANASATAGASPNPFQDAAALLPLLARVQPSP